MKLSILIPNHNEPKIGKMVKATNDVFKGFDVEIIVSHDKSGKGKGWALREALKESIGEVVCFIDGDLDIHPRMFYRLGAFICDYDIVIGKKIVRGSFWRRMLTRLSRLYIHLLFGMNYDTQTGIKMFHRYALLDWETDSYIFDLEILAKARKKGLQIIEVPVEVTDHGSSAKPMKIRNVIRALKDSFGLWRRLK